MPPVTVTVMLPPDPFGPLAVIVVVPAAMPVTTPVVRSTVATLGLLLVYVTPVPGFAASVMLLPARILGALAVPLLPLPPPAGAVRVIVTGFTVTLVVPLLVVKLGSPEYLAVIVWFVPTGSAVVLAIATPMPFTEPLPRVVLPRVKATVPVGVPPPGAVTARVAVRVTLPPKVEAAGMAVTPVTVAALLTLPVRACVRRSSDRL